MTKEVDMAAGTDASAAAEEARKQVLGPDPHPKYRKVHESELAKPLLEFSRSHMWEVYARPGLSLKMRCLVQVGITAAMDYPRALHDHMANALRMGNTPEEILEVVMQVALYAGMPAGMEAMIILIDVVDEAQAASGGAARTSKS